MGTDEHQGIYFEPMKKQRPLFTRRQMLKVGAIGGLTLAQYLRVQGAAVSYTHLTLPTILLV